MKGLELSLEFSEVDKKIEPKFSKKIINSFEEILEIGSSEQILLFILKNKISFSDFGGNFSPLQNLINNIDTKDIDDFFKLKIIQKRISFIEENILKNKRFYIEYLKMLKKNQSRQKGSSHFAKKFKKYFSNFVNVELIENIDDFKLKNNTIYVSSSDKILTKILTMNKVNNVPKKGIDLVMYFNNTFSFGEAKEINAQGGSQNHQFKDLERISKLENGFGILYGNILFSDNIISKTAKKNTSIYTLDEFKEILS